MELEIREYCEADLPGMAEIWNAIVEQGDSFPQEERMALNRARAFFQQQTFSGVAVDETGALQGLYSAPQQRGPMCPHSERLLRCAPWLPGLRCRGKAGEAFAEDVRPVWFSRATV